MNIECKNILGSNTTLFDYVNISQLDNSDIVQHIIVNMFLPNEF